MPDPVVQQCIHPDCAAVYPKTDVRVACEECGSLLDVKYDWQQLPRPSFDTFDQRRASFEHLDFSGVWRFRELLPFFDEPRQVMTMGEGRTILQNNCRVAEFVGLPPGTVELQYEGMNPSGSFKDNGMTAAFTHAKMIGAKRVACASTGNTSASLALYAAHADMNGLVFIGSGKIAFGKLSQALDYGARTLQIDGDFDDCLRRVRQVAVDRPELGVYLMNSVNPFRLEGQKAIMLRILEARGWRVPDWIVVPGGNLGNCSAFGKAYMELKELGLVDRVPRLAVINARGANTLFRLHEEQGLRWNGGRFNQEVPARLYAGYDDMQFRAKTVASAIEIGRPVNLPKALRALDFMNGVVREVDDRAILEGRATVARHGFGCEPASGASVAGVKKLVAEGIIEAGQDVVCILTGHELKDPDRTVSYHIGDEPGQQANPPVQVSNDLDAIVEALS
ncbi:MAG: threonine synthase [Planctomycetota bacterium]